MGKIYINSKETDVLAKLKTKINDKEAISVIDKILEQSERNRVIANDIARVYKAEKRKEDKMYARSKKEKEKYGKEQK